MQARSSTYQSILCKVHHKSSADELAQDIDAWWGEMFRIGFQSVGGSECTCGADERVCQLDSLCDVDGRFAIWR